MLASHLVTSEWIENFLVAAASLLVALSVCPLELSVIEVNKEV